MGLLYVCLVLGIISVVVFIRLRVEAVGIKALAVKVVAGVFYIFVAMIASAQVGYPVFGMLIAAGQIFGLLGDIFLDQKYMHEEQGTCYTHMGFSVFAIGHLLFIVGLILHYECSFIEVIIGLVGALLITGFVVLTEKPFGLNYGKMRLDVTTYSLIIGMSTMMPLSLFIFRGFEGTQLFIFFGGMIAFLISDLVLSQIYFAKGQNNSRNVIVNYVFYYGAQYIIAASILFLK